MSYLEIPIAESPIPLTIPSRERVTRPIRRPRDKKPQEQSK